MAPTLYQTYSFDAAIAAFGSVDQSEVMCDEQFVVLPAAVLCFVTVGDPANEPHVPMPSVVIWKPRRTDYVADEHWPWLPQPVREAQHQHKAHHLFIRAAANEGFLYAGAAHLGSYGVHGNSKDARFHLATKLPRDAWRHLGGFPGWLVEINHSVHRLDAADAVTFAALLDTMPHHRFSHLSITRYEQDSLHIYTNSRCAWLMYLRSPEDTGIYVRNPAYRGDPTTEEEFCCSCGIDLSFPAYQTVSHEDALQAARLFFIDKHLPDTVHWDLEQTSEA